MAAPRSAPHVASPSNGWQTLQRIAQDLGTDAASLTRLKAIAGVVTSVTFAYVLVIALQLDLAGDLVQDGMQVMPPQRLLFTGIRELMLSALAGAILVGLMVVIGAARAPTLVTVLALPLLLALFVPLNAGGLSWPIALAAVGVLLVAVHRRYENGDRVRLLPVLLGVLVAVTAITLTRYMAAAAVRPGRGGVQARARTNRAARSGRRFSCLKL